MFWSTKYKLAENEILQKDWALGCLFHSSDIACCEQLEISKSPNNLFVPLYLTDTISSLRVETT